MSTAKLTLEIKQLFQGKTVWVSWVGQTPDFGLSYGVTGKLMRVEENYLLFDCEGRPTIVLLGPGIVMREIPKRYDA